MRVGVLCHRFMHWGGGIDFLRTIVSSLEQFAPEVEIHMMLPTRGPHVSLAAAASDIRHVAYTFLRRPTHRRRQLGNEIRQVIADLAERPLSVHEIDRGPRALASAAKRLRLDAVLPAFDPLPTAFPVPWVGYVFDFQHCYYPMWFDPAELSNRDQHFRAMAAAATTVVVNARSVADDIDKFLPAAHANVFALPFGAAPRRDWLRIAPNVPARYGIVGPYYIVCNQFWKHKDHRTAFAAFAYWLSSGTHAHLVCTGEMDDYRDPGYVASLKAEISQLKIESRVHLLGRVPKPDQIALLQGSVALIQPTLFEGGPGGGAAFDAVALGVPCILSNIGVNREIENERVDYFQVGDARDLARLMQLAWERRTTRRKCADELLADGQQRRRACGEQLLRAIEHARTMASAKTQR